MKAARPAATDVAKALLEQPPGEPSCAVQAQTEQEAPRMVDRLSGPSVEGDEGGKQIGRFTYDVEQNRWDWDDEVFRIHGYEPGEVEPTTDLFLRHKHANDRQRVEATFEQAMRTGEAFNVYYRIHAGEALRRVVVVGEGVCDDAGTLTHLVGYYVDLTPEFTAESSAAADAAVAASARSRDRIEQAKGVLMLGYGLDADAAFAMLRWWSRNRNVKVREVAERLIDVAQGGHASHPGLRQLLDSLLHDLTSEGGTTGAQPTRPPRVD